MVGDVCHLEVREGRAVAKIALLPGQVILVEPPLVTGPGRNGKPVCLSCYSLVDAEYYCEECGWQLCGEQCCGGPHATECAALKERGIEATWEDVEEDTFVMDFLGPFRLLVALRGDPRREELLGRDMQTERRQRKFDSRYYQNCETSLMKYIRDTCGVTDYSDQHILNALGLFEMYGINMQNGSKALYPTLTSLDHHCSPNTYSMVLPDGRILVRASVAIQQGEGVTRSLVDPFTCTMLRRRELESSFLVDCCCARCSDPTEFGTCLGGLCSEAHGGAVFLPSQPLKEDGGAWTCSSLPGEELGGAASTSKMVSLTRKCAEGLSQARGSTQCLEFILNPLVEGEWDVLPRHGQVMLGIKNLLVTAWSNPGLEEEKLRTKLSYCEELVAVLAAVHPGRSYPAIVLHYQAAATAHALIQAKDSSMVEVGLKHAQAAAEMADQEEGTMYAQLREAVLQLKDQIAGKC